MRIAILAAALSLCGCATIAEPDPIPPAGVAVVFDRDSIDPVIVQGVANQATFRPVEANDPVRIASISKFIMALATLRLADEGRVDLSADVSEYLGWSVRNPAYPGAKVTLAQLLSHRSGLRDDAGYVIPLGESLEAKLAQPEAWYADAPPGQAPFEYANLGSPVVATVLEAASGERYDRLVDRLIFAPLGIDACLNWIGCGEDTVARAVTLYRSTGEVARDDAGDLPPNCTFPIAEGVECSLEDYVPGTNASIFSPQGGVRIGMVDLARLGQAVIKGGEGGFLSPKAWSAIVLSAAANGTGDQEFFCAYGLGVQFLNPLGKTCKNDLFGPYDRPMGHAGEAYSLRSGLWFDAYKGKSIAYFITQVPERTVPDEGGFAPEEVAFARRAMLAATEAGK
ncbi:serine hydrolase [Qipengyuania sp. XHP0207]|uniref:serine hydrolase domain-containing protein n=1 Tax=Qipengyuania sp. XHP0207 TaxID=3038078 RepID=UPI00241C30F5|nr:serine hydrolase domain-containing protein [Qipengyuania sp. XHP0207]MDG5749292.1 serine hydrolase [Qipengyuania sp. XHP0207]